MWEAKLEPDSVTTLGSAACEKGEQWQQALSLLGEMREAQLEPSVISYSAGISACEKVGHWQQALSLLVAMLEVKLEPDAISYSSGVTVCEKCGKWGLALSLLSELWRMNLELSAPNFNSGIGVYERSLGSCGGFPGFLRIGISCFPNSGDAPCTRAARETSGAVK
ncbi:unnamed protein product [Prorocentrum cordatum]|uniref:Pentatricopeptide repeat-containing protein, chloroplastic n=1 Tax=Prorocentrum cordatum TaxID=2364126 RepID=A0ABN9VB01_9DINO|nr:unnamed protein product [Polarella glacialis]